MAASFVIPGEVMKSFINIAIDVGGDLGQSQMLLEKIRDKYCLNFIVPNMWQYEYDSTEEMPQE